MLNYLNLLVFQKKTDKKPKKIKEFLVSNTIENSDIYDKNENRIHRIVQKSCKKL